MQAGTLRYRMAIEQRATTRTGSGAPAEAWSTFAKVWAGFEELTGRELMAAQKLVAGSTCKITIRYIPGVVPEMRVNWLDRRAKTTRIFDILNSSDEMERHRSLELLCSENDIKPGETIAGPVSAPAVALPYGRKSFTGAIDGVNQVYILPGNPDPNILQAFRNGDLQTSPGDFALNGNQVTYTAPPAAGDSLAFFF